MTCSEKPGSRTVKLLCCEGSSCLSRSNNFLMSTNVLPPSLNGDSPVRTRSSFTCEKDNDEDAYTEMKLNAAEDTLLGEGDVDDLLPRGMYTPGGHKGLQSAKHQRAIKKATIDLDSALAAHKKASPSKSPGKPGSKKNARAWVHEETQLLANVRNFGEYAEHDAFDWKDTEHGTRRKL